MWREGEGEGGREGIGGGRVRWTEGVCGGECAKGRGIGAEADALEGAWLDAAISFYVFLGLILSATYSDGCMYVHEN